MGQQLVSQCVSSCSHVFVTWTFLSTLPINKRLFDDSAQLFNLLLLPDRLLPYSVVKNAPISFPTCEQPTTFTPMSLLHSHTHLTLLPHICTHAHTDTQVLILPTQSDVGWQDAPVLPHRESLCSYLALWHNTDFLTVTTMSCCFFSP